MIPLFSITEQSLKLHLVFTPVTASIPPWQLILSFLRHSSTKGTIAGCRLRCSEETLRDSFMLSYKTHAPFAPISAPYPRGCRGMSFQRAWKCLCREYSYASRREPALLTSKPITKVENIVIKPTSKVRTACVSFSAFCESIPS